MINKITKIVIIFLIFNNKYCLGMERPIYNYNHLAEVHIKWDDALLQSSLKIVNDSEHKVISEKEDWEEYKTFSSKAMAISPKDCLLAVAYTTGIHIWHLPMKKIINYLNPEADIIRAITFSSDGNRLAILTNEPAIEIIDINQGESGTIVKSIPIQLKENQKITSLAIGSDDNNVDVDNDKFIYARDNDGIIYACQIDGQDNDLKIINPNYYSIINDLLNNPRIETVDHRFRMDISGNVPKILKNPSITSELDIKRKEEKRLEELKPKEDVVKRKKRCGLDSTCVII